MTRLLATAVVVFSALLPVFAQTQTPTPTENASQDTKNHVITVIRNGTVFAKPDIGILAMELRSTAALAEEAVAANGQKAKDVSAALTKLGYAPDGFQITSVIIGQGGGPYYGPAQPAITTYEASQYVYVFFQAADLSDVVKLTEKSVAVLEALRKAGAVPANTVGPRSPQTQGGMIIYTIKDSDPFERQALQKAIARARDAAQDLATGMQVQITGVRNIRASALGGNYMPRSGLSYLEGLPYRFYSTKSDEIGISANVSVDYDFK
jgi:uncharacterized protein YggE